MAKGEKLTFQPDYAIAPGLTLAETLEAMGMTQAELSKRAGLTPKTINGIVKGKEPLTSETALRLQRSLGIKASFWNRLETNYREALAAQEESHRLEQWSDWAKTVPYKALARLGVVPFTSDKRELVAALLDFFGVSSPGAWWELWAKPAAAFRSSPTFASHPGAVAAWLRMGELEAQRLTCQSYSEADFRVVLRKARGLTKQDPKDFCPALAEMAAVAGVAVVFIPELPGLRLSGATRWIKDRALIQLDLRHKRNDQLWFTFFHEAGHILLHGKRDIFLEGDQGLDAQKEDEANRFACDWLIPPKEYRRLLDEAGANRISSRRIENFADRIGVHPGIVVGRLQHEKIIGFNQQNELIQRLAWSNN